MYSLGSILLEVLVFHREATLEQLERDRSSNNSAYNANFQYLGTWLPWSVHTDPRKHNFVRETRAMLEEDSRKQPDAEVVLLRMGMFGSLSKPARIPERSAMLWVSSVEDKNLSRRCNY